MFGNCIFNIESIPICDGGAPICVTKAALDDIEVAVDQDDSSGVPNTKQPESLWHRVSGATIVVESGFKLFVDRNLSAFWMQGLPVGFKIYEHSYHQTKIGMHLLITVIDQLK